MNSIKTTVCISGAGPAGIMLGFLLARAGIDVTVLEMWPDFFRDFRGDTIHPSTMQVLRELGLYEKFLALPHNQTNQLAVHIGGEEIIIADFTHLKRVPAFLGFIPQWDFLNFIATEAKQYPNFHVLMETKAIDLLWERRNDEHLEKKISARKVVGVKAQNTGGEFEIHATLVIGADGRHSTIREKANLPLHDLGAPIDVLWFELPRKESGKQESLGSINQGKMMILIDRDTYWQGGFVIQKGSFDALQSEGIEVFRESIMTLEPSLGLSAEEMAQALPNWDKVKMLSVAVDHLSNWHLPGLLCIGDAAHAMSPVGGVGINLAIQDAVAAANALIPALSSPVNSRFSTAPASSENSIQEALLQKIQTRRSKPALQIQKLQVFIHTHVVEKILQSKGTARVPWQLRLVQAIPYLRRIPAYIIGVGFQPEHVHERQQHAS